MNVCRKEIKKIQIGEATMNFFDSFFAVAENQNKIVLIYDEKKLKTLLSIEDMKRIKNENHLQYYLRTSNNNHFWDKDETEQIAEAFRRFPMFRYYIVSINETDGLFIDKNYKINETVKILKDRGVHVFELGIPMAKEIENDKCHNKKIKYNLADYYELISCGMFEVPRYIEQITDETDIKRTQLCNKLGNRAFGDYTKTLYLVGPCIVMGDANFEKESLPEILAGKIRESFESGYTVQPIRQIVQNDREIPEILTYNIKKNDIVIFVNYVAIAGEFDLTDLYNSYEEGKWLYQDEPIHPTVTGNRLIADFVIEKIIRPVYESGDSLQDDEVIYQGEPYVTYEGKAEIEKYVDNIRKMRYIPRDSIIGAVVMNCNPFTYGHRYLIEYAATQVDFLYLFVVEEDLSAVPFSDRLFMVYEGVKDIKNVIIAPSGSFIISKDTFVNYFEKETDIHEADAEEDVYIFARYIAKGLNIAKRFVGQEPIDEVTNAYNLTMKEVLPKYGIELVEIPRKELSDGAVISASLVRKMLMNNQWDEMRRFVPKTTLNYLKRIKETIAQRIEIQKSMDHSSDYTQGQMEDFIQNICSLDKVILYSIGNNTEKLLKRIPREAAKRIEYCDREARNGEVYFQHKKVLAPEQLLTTYKEYTIVVTSTVYGAQIYEDLLRMGIDMERCIFNRILY